MQDLTDVKFFLASIIRPLIREAIREDLKLLVTTPIIPTHITEIPPILSTQRLQDWTGWPDGTLYAKAAEMPEGVVIRNKSKRLIFNTNDFLAWLRDSH